MVRAAKFRVSLEVLREVLGLPETTVIRGITGDVVEQVFTRTVFVVVEDPALPEMHEASYPREVAPSWDDEGLLEDWGLGGEEIEGME